MASVELATRSPQTTKLGDTDNEVVPHFTVKYLRFSYFWALLYGLVVVGTGGLFYLIFVTNSDWMYRYLTHSECNYEDAEYVYFSDMNGYQYAKVEHLQLEGTKAVLFDVNCKRYISKRSKDGKLDTALVPDAPANFSEVFIFAEETSKDRPSRESLVVLYGENKMYVQSADFVTILWSNVTAPFYLFQYFAIAVWLYTDYIAYSCIVMIITMGSIYFTTKEELFNLQRLHNLVDSFANVEVIDESGKGTVVKDTSLVPGDRFAIKEGMALPCDAILLHGRVVVDESMLTGESVPVTKTSLDPKSLPAGEPRPDVTKRSASVLFSGTRVKFVTPGAIAVAYKTAFRSAKGQLVAALLIPKEEMLKFFEDAINAMIFMIVLTTAIFGWSASELKKIDTTDKDVVLAYLTALTIAVPPGLVACLSVATSISIGRLEYYHNIAVSETNRVNYAGTVSFAAFDKTGTLTDENIDYQGVQLKDLPKSEAKVFGNATSDDVAKELMATCHGMTVVDGAAAGDPLEVELLRASGWSLSSGTVIKAIPPTTISAPTCTIVRHFEFTPEKLRAGSIVTRGEDSKSSVYYVKGSPEVIEKLCDPSSVPSSFSAQLTTLSKKGFRVLALAYRSCDEYAATLNTVSQNDLESGHSLKYLGLVFFSSKLKPASKEMFEHFAKARIHASMITGDHIYTAIAIATECSLLPSIEKRRLCVIDANASGEPFINTDVDDDGGTHAKMTFQELFDLAEKPFGEDGRSVQIAITGSGLNGLRKSNPEFATRLLRDCKVFARMKPADKKSIVVALQELRDDNGETCKVIYCGDGANDMAALSAATVGVSLCDAETTVAASVVSRKQVPTAVIQVLREGRCSLITAYCLVSYNIMYAIIQLFMTCFLNNIGLIFGDNMYIVQDLFFSLFLGLSIAYVEPQDNLDVTLPPQRYLSKGIMLKLIGQLIIFPLFQYFSLLALRTQDWYHEFKTDDPLTESISYESTTINAIALAQLMIASVVVTIGKPFRKPWWSSQAHWACFLGQSVWVLYVIFGKYDKFLRLMSNLPVKGEFGFFILFLILCNIVVSAAWTKFADRYIS